MRCIITVTTPEMPKILPLSQVMFATMRHVSLKPPHKHAAPLSQRDAVAPRQSVSLLIRGRKKRREVSYQGLLFLLFWIFILLLQWSQLDLFLRNSHNLSHGTKTARVLFRNFSYWCALNTVVIVVLCCVWNLKYLALILVCVARMFCKQLVLSRSKRYLELPLPVP